MRAAVYDLAVRAANWDFVIWAVNVRDLGYKQINLFAGDLAKKKDLKWLTPAQIMWRVDNIMIPAVWALGMRYELHDKGDRHVGSDHYYHFRPNFRRLEVAAPWHGKHTVTLRNTPYKPYRNSNRAVWLEFARRINAIVIEDHSIAPISFEERFRLYAGAAMNWGVSNGPTAALFTTPYPVTMMCDEIFDRKGFAGLHILPGGQVPCSLPNQNLVWGDITVARLTEQYRKFYEEYRCNNEPVHCRCSLAGDFEKFWRSK